MAELYPTEVRFRDLTPRQRRQRRSVSWDLAGQLEWLRGDPQLTAWEEGFLSGMVRQIRATEGGCRISEKQWKVIRRIQDKTLGGEETGARPPTAAELGEVWDEG